MKLAILPLLLTSLSQAQYIIEGASFGHGQGISPNKVAIPGWHISGEGNTPQILSDKVILTPPYPGNKRGALWTDARVIQSEWIANFDFRATGPEHGGGNLQIWYTREGEAGIGSSSVYTVGKFEGLVLVIDMYGNRGGVIRGFLNDGSIDFKNHHHVESLAFGHCDYSYRNLGRPTNIQIKQDSSGFEVNVDNNICFRSDKVLLPSDNYFGITASSAENPDSFEIYKFALTTTPSITREEPRRVAQKPVPNPDTQQPATQPPIQDSPSSNSPPASPDTPQVSPSQLLPITVRLDALSSQLNMLSSTTDALLSTLTRSTEISSSQLTALENRISMLEARINDLHTETLTTHKGNEEKFEQMHKKLGEGHERLLGGLEERVGSLLEGRKGGRVWWVLGVLGAGFGVVGWWAWKRRRGSEKKYL